jgi:hypothetical protein
MQKALTLFLSVMGLLFVSNLFSGVRQDPPADQHYDLQSVCRGAIWGGGGSYLTNGPAGEAEDEDQIKGLSVDTNGNYFYSGSAYPVIRRYSKSKNWVSIIAGSTHGYMDGPLERARFGGWYYNNTNLISTSDDGKHMFVRDASNSVWRYIDLENETVSTIGPWNKTGCYFIIAKDCVSGEIYAFNTDGTDAPDCKGYKKIKSAPWKSIAWWNFDGIALDASKMRFYFHCRGPVVSVNLETGDTATISGPGWCPTGLSMSSSGRYLYIGGGDDMFCHRKDLTTGVVFRLGRSTISGTVSGVDAWFKDGSVDFSFPISGSTAWPSACVFPAGGTDGVWPTTLGLFMMVPRP